MERAANEIRTEIERVTRDVPTFAGLVSVAGETLLEWNADAELCACSTGKVAAATAVMALVQDGRIDLDAPAAELDARLRFPDPERGRRITLRMLLSHTSGLTDTEQVERDPLERLPGLRQIAEPGRAFLYSNVAFACGVAAAARRVGADERSLIAERVLAPLGMRATHWNARFVEGSSSEILATTVRDLALLADEQLGAGRVLEAPARAEMQRVHADSFAASGVRYYGLGIDVERWHGLDLLSHGGGLRNFGSTFLLDPAARASAVLLFDAPAGHDVSAHALLDRALGRTTAPLPVRALELDWRAYLGRYASGAELLEDAGEPHLRYRPVGLQRLHAHDARVLATAPVSLAGMRTRPIGVGFLPGEPTMISVNHFPPIGARPGRRLEPRA